MKFLLDIVDRLSCVDINGNAMRNGKRMLSAIVLTCCLYEMVPNCIKISAIPSDRVSALLSLLRLMPDLQNQKCADWDFLINFIPKSFRKTASDAVLALTMQLSHTKYFSLPDWLFAIPVVHFLRQDVFPFQEFQLDPRKIPWGDKLIGLQTVRSETNNKNIR